MLRHGLTAMINIQPDMAVVGEAESGAEALTAFRNLRPDITLMDLQMLDMGGEEAIGAISAEYLRTCGHSGIAAASTEEAVTVLNDASSIVFAMLCALPAVEIKAGSRSRSGCTNITPQSRSCLQVRSMPLRKQPQNFAPKAQDLRARMIAKRLSSGSSLCVKNDGKVSFQHLSADVIDLGAPGQSSKLRLGLPPPTHR